MWVLLGNVPDQEKQIFRLQPPKSQKKQCLVLYSNWRY